MSNLSRFDPDNDPHRPPDVPIMVICTHCGKEYDSYLMYWEQIVVDGEEIGFWTCPTQGCEATGFGIDIVPLDPEQGKEFMDYETEDEEDSYDCDCREDENQHTGELLDMMFNPPDGGHYDNEDWDADEDDDCPWSPF